MRKRLSAGNFCQKSCDRYLLIRIKLPSKQQTVFLNTWFDTHLFHNPYFVPDYKSMVINEIQVLKEYNKNTLSE